MRLPSIQALRAVECFDRHGTVWQAAEELNLTRSAVSHQLRLLERELGFTLFNRVGTRVELTPRGRAYANDVRAALRALSSSAARNAQDGTGGSLTVSCTPGFAASWLCPNIGSFLEAHPNITLSLRTPRRLDDTSNPDVDLFITFGTDEPSDMHAEFLQDVEFTPLCNPAYLNRFSGFGDMAELSNAVLLHLGDHEDWATWLRSVGARDQDARRGVVFSDMNLAHVAALTGQGVAMGDRFTCKAALDAGQLVAPFEHAIATSNAYRLAIPNAKIDSPTVSAFRVWLSLYFPDPKQREA